MPKTIRLKFHSKRHSDFDLLRIVRAQAQGFEAPVTAYLCSVCIQSSSAFGVVFGHTQRKRNRLFEDGHLVHTSRIVSARKEGRFWVLTTLDSRYVIATFLRDAGRRKFGHLLKALAQDEFTQQPILH